jgi:hypothetical protein
MGPKTKKMFLRHPFLGMEKPVGGSPEYKDKAVKVAKKSK